MVNTVARGAITTFDAYFYDDDNNTVPQYVVGGVTYTITAFNNMMIASGVAEQDQYNLARWKLTFTIPLTAPTTGPNDTYTLLWKARRTDNGLNQQRDSFIVVDSNDLSDSDPNSTATIAIVNQPFNIPLKTTDNNITSLSMRVLKAGSDRPVITLANLVDINGDGITPDQDGIYYRYNIPINEQSLVPINTLNGGAISTGGMAMWYAYFNYIDSYGNQQTVINPVYIVTNTMIYMMDAINQYCNILRNQEVVRELQITEAKLIHFAMQGLMKLNATSPGNFSFNFATLGAAGTWGDTFMFWAIKCAQYELLNALLLGEGMSAFEFSGMTVQLNSDRTQYIAQAIANIESDLQNLPRIKSQYARAGGSSGRIGTIGLAWGPNLSYGFRLNSNTKFNGNPTPFGGPMLPFLK